MARNKRQANSPHGNDIFSREVWDENNQATADEHEPPTTNTFTDVAAPTIPGLSDLQTTEEIDVDPLRYGHVGTFGEPKRGAGRRSRLSHEEQEKLLHGVLPQTTGLDQTKRRTRRRIGEHQITHRVAGHAGVTRDDTQNLFKQMPTVDDPAVQEEIAIAQSVEAEEHASKPMTHRTPLTPFQNLAPDAKPNETVDTPVSPTPDPTVAITLHKDALSANTFTAPIVEPTVALSPEPAVPVEDVNIETVNDFVDDEPSFALPEQTIINEKFTPSHLIEETYEPTAVPEANVVHDAVANASSYDVETFNAANLDFFADPAPSYEQKITRADMRSKTRQIPIPSIDFDKIKHSKAARLVVSHKLFSAAAVIVILFGVFFLGSLVGSSKDKPSTKDDSTTVEKPLFTPPSEEGVVVTLPTDNLPEVQYDQNGNVINSGNLNNNFDK